MKEQLKRILLISFCLLTGGSYAQFSSPGKQITDDQTPLQHAKLYKGIGLDTIDCNGDTLQYGRFKASSLRAINVSKGYALGQFYSAPGEVSIAGFSFYAWANSTATDSIEIICRVYEADSDSLPKGKLLQTERLKIDTSFGGGLLSVLEKKIKFDTVVITDKPFILVLESNDTNRVAVVANDWLSGDGERENLACGTVGGTWYRCLNLNISGNPLDCDILMEPHVQYSLSVDFSFDDCYNYRDSVKFKNRSSDFFFDPMYNRWALNNNQRFSFLWNYGHNAGSYYAEEGAIRYSNPDNYDIRLIGRLLHYKTSTYCIDTMIRNLYYRPSEISFTGNNTDSMCSGDSARLLALSNGNISWYRTPNDTAFLYGNTYVSGPKYRNDTVYVVSRNEHCSSRLLEKITRVNQTPKILSVLNDSVCLNSIANLSANTDTGTIRWYRDSIGGLYFHQGEVYSTGNLSNPQKFYVQAYHRGCYSTKRLSVQAFVGIDFAPAEPQVVRDTLVCLLDGNVQIKAAAKNNDQLRWYTDPSGGSHFQTGNLLNVSINKLGRQTFYVDAFDGNCASSRLSVSVRTFTFPTFSNQQGSMETCEGDSMTTDLGIQNGFARWYETETDMNWIHEGSSLVLKNLSNDTSFWFVPTNGICADTARYPLEILVHPYGILNSSNQQKEACSGKSITLQAQSQIGTIVWYGDSAANNELGRGNLYTIPAPEKPTTYYFAADNRGCRSAINSYELSVLPSADASFDFSVIEPGSFQFAARTNGQGFYRWNMGDGGTANGFRVNHTFDKNGDYEVQLVVVPQNGCNDTAIRKISVSGLASLALHPTNNFIQVFPNPFDHQLNIESNTILYATMVDISGRIILSKRLEVKEQLDTRELEKGMYLLHLSEPSTGELYETFKLIKTY